jgi:hypothetical protein
MNAARRRFLGAGALFGAFAAPGSSPARAEPGQGGERVVIVDERLADSRAFALRARLTGARIVPLRGDTGALWHACLLPLGDARATTIAGLTTHADAFVLMHFARQSGMRCTRQDAGALVSWQAAPPHACAR